MTSNFERALSTDELEGQHTAQLPARDLMIAVSVLGIPTVGVDGLAANVNTSNWLFGAATKVA